MDTRFLESYITVVDSGSIAEAARRLNLTPAAVAQRIRALEAEIGVQLAIRSGRAVKPTEAGSAILAHARSFLSNLRDLHSIATTPTLSGQLRLGAMTTAISGLLPDALVLLTRTHPQIDVYILPGTSGALYEKVLNGDLDAAIIAQPQFAIPKSCDWTLLREEPLVLLTPSSMPVRDPNVILATEPFIRFDRNNWGGRLVDGYLRRHGIRPRERFELDGLAAIAVMVDRGLGVSLLPDWGPPWPEGLSLLKRQVSDQSFARRVGLIWTRASVRARLVRALLAEMNAVLTTGPISGRAASAPRQSPRGRQEAARQLERAVRPSAILLAGPTASGKSSLALKLAYALDGVIINADSMQVYRDLRIITARPTLAEEAAVPHRLYGHVDAAENYSVGRWCVDAAAALGAAQRARRLPIFVGGTGLYFKALTRGLAAVPPIPAELRARVRNQLKAEGIAPLYAELQRRDPAGAERMMPNDRSRITRALEVVIATSRPLADWHRDGMPPALDASRAVKIFLAPERAALYRHIDERFELMLVAGALEEVRALAARGLDPSLPAMKAHGVSWLIRHLNGEIALEEAAEGSQRDTRRYTKRQGTWFRHQLPEFMWVEPTAAERAVLEAVRKHGQS